MVGRVRMRDPVENPGLKFGILSRQQLGKPIPFARVRRCVMFVEVTFQDIVQFKHPAAALPA